LLSSKTPKITITIETALQDDIRELVIALDRHLEPLSPIEHQYKMSVEEMAITDTRLFVARDDFGKALGMGALKSHANNIGEVKRMFTIKEARGQRVGSLLLGQIILRAEKSGMKKLVLETGFGDGYVGAHRLYQRCGFNICGPVLDYEDTGSSAFFEMEIVV